MSAYDRGTPKGVEYTPDDLKRIADAAWNVRCLVSHPDDVWSEQLAADIREFNRALDQFPPLAR